MKEADAKKLWCPFAQVMLDRQPSGPPGVILQKDRPITGFNRIDNGVGMVGYPSGANCIGRACMLWEPVLLGKPDPDDGRCGGRR